MVTIKAEQFWESEESNDVNSNGPIDVERPNQSIRGDLTIQHLEAAFEHEFDKIEIQQIHETIQISVV